MLSTTRSLSQCLSSVLLILFGSIFAWSQANINENQETAVIYVDTKTGNDSNPGTQTEPLKTIGAAITMAVNNNHSGVGSRVIINPGTYREALSLGKGGRSSNLPMTFEAATNGTVIVSGADVWTGWVPENGNASIYTQSWPYRWGLCQGDPTAPTEQDIILRQEMLIVNGKPLTEVLTSTAMQPGTFFPDESNSTVYVWPPAGTNMSTATVEVATRSNLFTDSGQSYVVLRGLTFQYANSCHQNAAVNIVGGATNVLLDTDNFLWNNAAGLALNGTVENFTVQSSVASHNGQIGFTTSQVKNGLWQSDTTSYNNWRGAQGAFYSWDTGGTKFLLDHDSTFNQLTTIFNQTHGASFDTDNKNETMNSVVAVGNVGTGFYTEKSEGPLTFTNSAFCTNNLANNAYLGGVTVRDSSSVSLSGTSLYGNGTAQVYVLGEAGGFQITDWETGQVYNVNNENMTLSKNIQVGSSSAQLFSDGALGGSDWSKFVSTLNSNNNTWWASNNGSAFTVPSPAKWTNLNLSGWQSTTGQDSSSKWTSVSTPAACNIASQGPDFWLLMMTLTSKPVVLNAAGTATWNLATLPLGGMQGTVNLSLDGLSSIPGASASFSPASISTSSTSALTLTAGLKTPAGTYPVTIIANNGSVTHTITVSAVVPKTSVRLSTTTLTFAPQSVGTKSQPQTVTLTNTGSQPLSISGIASYGVFTETNNCGGSVKAGGSCTISVTFSPRSTGATSERMNIQDGDPTSPQIVTMTGTGLAAPEVKVSPTYLGFGVHKVGTTATKTVTLNNEGGAALKITSMNISGASSKDFTQTNNCGSSLAAGYACTVNVTFKPATDGQQSASLSINDNNSGSGTQTVSLAGNGN